LAHHETLNAFADDELACEYRQGALYGSKLAALHADCADKLIVSARDTSTYGPVGLYLVDAGAPGLHVDAFRLLDGRGAANLHFDAVVAEPLDAPGSRDASRAALAVALEEATVALCREALGAIRALNAATLAYVKTRKQFGRAIGANQALQHRLVETYVLEQEVRAMTLAAERALDAGVAGAGAADAIGVGVAGAGAAGAPGPATNAERMRIISGARAFICDAARRVAAEAVQMHGGIGVSDELDVSHYYRRVMVIGTLFGNREFHFTRFSELGG